MRPAPRRRRRFWRRSVQAAFLTLFLGAVVFSCLGITPEAGSWFLRLDVLSGLSAMLAGRVFLPAFLPALGLVLLTLLLGRAWCGWICPLGTLLEWIGRGHTRLRVAPAWYRVKYGLLLALLVGALLGAPGLVLLDPLPLLERGLVSIIRPALGASAGAGRAFHPADLSSLFLLAGLLALNAVSPRLWCRALCPLGALLVLLARPAGLRRQVESSCSGCGECAARCPMGAIREDTWENAPQECILCLECADRCPQQAVGWRWSHPNASPTFDPSRRTLLVALGAGVLLSGLLWGERTWGKRSPRLLRPPGAVEEEVLSRCLRCGACLAACPTGALRPALLEAGLAGLWTPFLFPRSGYCRYTCNACGQACPSGAIRPLSVAEKQVWVIGIARVDPTRCLTWTENRHCTVCQETCPVVGPAVELRPEEALSPLGERIRVKRPRVIADLCIGCGICEYNCPVEGEAAIQVWPLPRRV